MTDTSALPQFVVSAFDGREFPNWASQSRETLLNHFLEWNGIRGYTGQILQALASIDQFLIDNTEPTVPAWQLPMFTDQDREAIVTAMMDELSDASVKDLAHDALEHLSLVETIGYVFPDDTEELVSMLQSIENEDYVNGEFLRAHDEDDEYGSLIDFAVRMGLLTQDEESVTDLGRQFIGEHS